MQYSTIFWLLLLGREIYAPNSRIYNGQQAALGQFPYMALLRIETTFATSTLCAGSLLNQQFILTAAHCLTDVDTLEVVLGSIDQNAPATATPTKFCTHENYNPDTGANDVGLIKLPQNVTYSENIQPLPLPTGQKSYEKLQATVSGWGSLGPGSLASSTLQYTTVTIISNKECKKEYPSMIQPTNLCTKDPNTGPCQGDDGAPLVFNGTQIGIYNFGSRNGSCTDGPAVAYARVTKYVGWIRKKAGIKS